MSEGQHQRVILMGAAGTLAVLFGLYVFVLLLRVIWARWQAYLSRWARDRVDWEERMLKSHRHHHRPSGRKKKATAGGGDSDSGSWSSSDESDSRSY